MNFSKSLFTAVLAGIILIPLTFSSALGEDFTKPSEPKSREVAVGAIGAFIPSNFDSRSEAFAVVNGIFPNSCYRIKEVKVTHVSPTLHEVRTVATVSEGLCLTVMIPFNKEVQLGQLVPGDHEVRFLAGDGTYLTKTLTIEN